MGSMMLKHNDAEDDPALVQGNDSCKDGWAQYWAQFPRAKGIFSSLLLTCMSMSAPTGSILRQKVVTAVICSESSGSKGQHGHSRWCWHQPLMGCLRRQCPDAHEREASEEGGPPVDERLQGHLRQ